MQVNIYLGYPGTAAAAFDFYKSVLGGELLMAMTYAEAPPEDCPTQEGWEDKIMHASLKVGNMVLMASDLSEDHYQTPQGYHISLGVEDEDEAKRIFAELSAGGVIKMPLAQTFWAKQFGMFTDRFGIDWMVNCE